MKRLAVCLLVVWVSAAGRAFAVPAVPQNLRVVVAGNVVTVSWDASPGALSYILSAGTLPGLQDFAVSDVGLRTTFVASGVPTGRFYVRVAARDATGFSGTSNEVTAMVGGAACSAAPMAPNGPIAVVFAGGEVAVRWLSGPGCAATGYVLQAGTGPGRTDVASATLNSTSLNTVAPRGTYYVRLLGTNSFGTSPASSETVVRVDGHESVGGWLGGLHFFPAPLFSTLSVQDIATLTWTDPSVPVDFYIVATSCLSPTTCPRVATSSVVSATERQLIFSGSSREYVMVVENLSNTPVNFSLVSR